MTILLCLFVAEGLLLAALSLPLIARKVGPNAWYGFRVRRTLDNPNVWYPVNAFAGKLLLCLGLGTSVTAALLYLVPGLRLALYASLVAILFALGLAVCLLLSFRYLAAVARQQHGSDSTR